jgi:hypothetical protein
VIPIQLSMNDQFRALRRRKARRSYPARAKDGLNGVGGVVPTTDALSLPRVAGRVKGKGVCCWHKSAN